MYILNKLKTPDVLLDILAAMCHYAQEHTDWGGDDYERQQILETTSYQVSCFLAQNTSEGSNGVESDIVIEQLEEKTHSIKAWKGILEDIVFNQLGGFLC